MQEASSDTRGPVRGQLGGPCLCWGCTIEWRFKIMEAVADPADPPAAAAAADLLLLAGQKTRNTTVAEATGSASEPEWGCVASPPPVKIELAEAADGLMRTGTAMVQHAFGTVHYEGRLDGAGKASGKGEGTWLDGAWKGVVYEGQWTENLPLGWGNWKILRQATCSWHANCSVAALQSNSGVDWRRTSIAASIRLRCAPTPRFGTSCADTHFNYNNKT